jgi:DNA polymerase-3 subunit epsilon
VDLSERDLHGALLDSRLLAEVYLELRGGKQFSMNLAKNNQENNKNTTTTKQVIQKTPQGLCL